MKDSLHSGEKSIRTTSKKDTEIVEVGVNENFVLEYGRKKERADWEMYWKPIVYKN